MLLRGWLVDHMLPRCTYVSGPLPRLPCWSESHLGGCHGPGLPKQVRCFPYLQHTAPTETCVTRTQLCPGWTTHPSDATFPLFIHDCHLSSVQLCVNNPSPDFTSVET